MPSTWKRYGVDANHDGRKDPYNPVDAIFAAARYLKAAGADQDVRAGDLRLQPRRLVRRLRPHARASDRRPARRPRRLADRPHAGPLPGARQGALRRRHQRHRHRQEADQERQRRAAGHLVEHAPRDQRLRQGRLAGDRRPGRQDRQDGPHRSSGQVHPAARRLRQHLHLRAPEEALDRLPGAQGEDGLQGPGQEGAAPRGADEGPQADGPRQRGHAAQGQGARRRAGRRRRQRGRRHRDLHARQRRSRVRKERLFANPGRPGAYDAGGEEQLLNAGSVIPGYTTFKSYFTGIYGLKRDDVVLKKLKPGSKVIAGTILGRIGRTEQKMAPHMLFEVRPAGRGAPRIDPKPILDGWKLLESTAIYRAAGKNPFWGPDSKNPSIGQILLMSKEALQHRVLTDPRHRHLRLRPPRHRGRRHRPPRARHARVPGRQRPEADGQRAALRPQLPDRPRATSPSTPRAAPSTSRRSTASRSSATRARARSPTSRSAGC